MTRLYEEVFTRLEEMAMITVRALKLDAAGGAGGEIQSSGRTAESMTCPL